MLHPEYGYGSRRYVFKNYWNHTHIDLFSIFSNKVVKGFLEAEQEGKYGYRSDYPKLEDVAQALTGKGKLKGLTGLKVLKLSKEEQKDYVLQDSALLYNIILSKPGKMVIDLLNEFAHAINTDLEWIAHTSIIAWWAKIFDDLGCTRPQGQVKEPYGGGLVLPCKSGYYENVVLVDVKSLYPTMAIIHNLGFDTIGCSCCEHDPQARVPRWALIDPDGHPINKEYWVCRKKISVYRDRLIVFRDLKDAADRDGKKMAKQAYKLLMNASYGAFARTGAAYLFLAVAELITSWGRFTLRVMNAVALAMGLEPIAGDTDSLFLANIKSKEQLDEYFKRCQELLRVQDPLLTEKGYWDVEIENKLFDKNAAPVTFKCFWNVMKKHSYFIRTDGKFDSTSLEIEKDNTVAYSGDVLWKQWKMDMENSLDPIVNLKGLTSEQELKTVLENNPELLQNSQELGENPGIIDQNTGEIKGCTYKKPDDPLPVVAREQGLELGDICYFYKTGENKRIIKVEDEATGKPLGTYTTNPKYASITKIKEDIASAWMNPLKVYYGYKIPNQPKILDTETNKTRKKKQKEMTLTERAIMKADKEAEHKIMEEVFGLDNDNN
jgi:hypothetical protein